MQFVHACCVYQIYIQNTKVSFPFTSFYPLTLRRFLLFSSPCPIMNEVSPISDRKKEWVPICSLFYLFLLNYTKSGRKKKLNYKVSPQYLTFILHFGVSEMGWRCSYQDYECFLVLMGIACINVGSLCPSLGSTY